VVEKDVNFINEDLAKFVNLAPKGYSMSELEQRGQFMAQLGRDLRKRITEPMPRKAAPTYSVSQLAEICRVDRQRINYLCNKESSTLPRGRMVGRSRVFTLEEVLEWVQTVNALKVPENWRAPIIVSANFKGGSTKSTTAMCLAQGLTLRGRKVLLVDLDPQATLTELCGFYADAEISEDQTVAPFLASFADDEPMKDLSYAVKPTYWKNIDLIPASAELFGAEFNYPAIIKKRPEQAIWALLEKGLAPLRDSYSYVILDTPPSLSYTTVNALMAANSVLMPLVPDSLDFLSSLQFWKLFGDLNGVLAKDENAVGKSYDLINVLLSKVDYNSAATGLIRQWALQAYGNWLLNTEVPRSAAVANSAMRVNTVYDLTKSQDDSSKKTIDRVREPLNRVCEYIDEFYRAKFYLMSQSGEGSENEAVHGE